MIEQLKTIRHHLEPLKNNSGVRKAVDALTQLEAMVGEPWLDERGYTLTTPLHTAAPAAQQYEAGDMASAAAQGFRDGVASVTQQEPVAEVYRHGRDSHGREWHGIYWYDPNLDVPSGTKLYTAAPVAQQPQTTCKTCGRRMDDPAVIHGPNGCCPAQQPQAKPHKPLFADLIAQHPGLREELRDMDKQPQAEAVTQPEGRCRWCLTYNGHQDGCPEAPHQAEVGPSDVVRDAVAAEREACAALAQGYAGQVGDVAWAVASAIRGRVNAAIAQQKGGV